MISVVIPAYNAAGTIAGTLHALRCQTMPRHHYEIVVVDDGSSDGTCQVVGQYVRRDESPTVQLIRQAHQGAAAARNAGAYAAQGDIIVFLDSDCVPAPDWLENLVAPLAWDDVVGGSGYVRTRQRSLLPRFVQLEYDERYERVAQREYIDFISSATAAYQREAFIEAGGFDTAMLGAEDVDLSFRLAGAGRKLVFVPDAVVYHTHPETLQAYVIRKFKYAFWRANVYGRYPRKVADDSRTPHTQKLQILLSPLVGMSILGSVLWRPLRLVAALTSAGFLASSAGFVKRVWRADPLVALVAPFLQLVSAWAAAAGLAAGIANRAVDGRQ